jgi:2-polyprenyl-6-hydroxyphenyl methylase/3-demethylubiquinone-9 3-methyltransferase
MAITGNDAIDFHDAIAADFAHRYTSSVAFQERFQVWTQLFDRYMKSTDYVLDLGCGPGIFSNYLASRTRRVIGIDGSATMIDLCRQQNHSNNVDYVLEKLPLLEANAYGLHDVVIMSSLLEYLDDMPIMLQQVRQLLSPNGLFIVSLPNELSVYRRVEQLIFKLSGRPRYVAHIHNISTESAFNQELFSLGFGLVETVYFSSSDPISTLLKPLFGSKYVNNLFVGVYQKRR